MRPPPTIAFVIPHGVQLFYPHLMHKQGGAEVQLALLVRELARRGQVRPVVLLGAYGQPAQDEIDGIRLLSFAHRGGLPGRLSLWRALWQSRAHAVVQRGMGSMAANVALYTTLARRSFIYWFASDLDPTPDALQGVRDPLRTRSFEWGLRRATAHIAQHEGQAELLRRHLHSAAAAVIPNGWPAQPCPAGPRRHHLWIGNATVRKNPEALLEIAAALPDERFLMVMPPEGGEADCAERVRARLTTLSNVECRGRVPFVEMRELYAQAKTLIMTSLAEGFPNTMLQALWSGTPVLSLFVDPGGMLTRNALGLCSQGDVPRLVNEMRHYAADEAAWVAAGRRAYDYAAAELSVARVAERFLTVLEGLKL
jgi:glycosyltransferase involved in cell wall biosynthesis